LRLGQDRDSTTKTSTTLAQSRFERMQRSPKIEPVPQTGMIRT
jgi:hypothetical protein